MSGNFPPQTQAISSAIMTLHRIEALACAIENMTDELQGFNQLNSTGEGMCQDKSNTIYHLAGMLREMAEQAINFSLEIQEGIGKA